MKTILFQLFRVIVLLALLVISSILISCDRVESERLKLDRNFYFYEVLSEYIIATKDLRSASRSFELSDSNFAGVPSNEQKYRFDVIRKMLDEYEIKSISKLDSEITFNLHNQGVFGDSHLSLVYSEKPERSVKLNTPGIKGSTIEFSRWRP